MLVVQCVVAKGKVLKACLGTFVEATLINFEKTTAKTTKQTDKTFSLANPALGNQVTMDIETMPIITLVPQCW